MMIKQYLVLIPVMISLSACSTVPIVPEATKTLPFILERDLAGTSKASGVFVNGITGERRKFNVKLNGIANRNQFTLKEDFAYEDGERDTKTWVFTRISSTEYSGTREDVVGSAVIKSVDHKVTLSYDVELKMKNNSKLTVHFEDVLWKQDAKTIFNRAIVSKWGVPIGNVDLEFKTE